MAEAKKKKGGVISVAARTVIAGPPGQLGYSRLTTPDEKFGKFQADIHYSEADFQALAKMFEAESVALIPKFAEKAERKVEVSQAPVISAWMEEQVKPADAKLKADGIENDYMRFSKPGTRKVKGEEVKNTIQVWDTKRNLLDLSKLFMGRGSVVQPVLTPKLWTNPLVKGAPQFTTELTGFIVVELKQYARASGGSVDLSKVKTVDGADLSQYVANNQTEGGSDEGDDEVTF